MDPDISSMIETTKGFLLNPVETFQQHADTSLAKAFQYYAVLVLVFAVLFAIVEGALLSFASVFSHGGGLIGLATGTFVLFIISIVILASLIGIFFNGLFQHIFVLLVGGEQGVAQTLKAFMYSSVPALIFGWIPIINIIAAIWSLVLLIIGIRELHKISTTNAIAAVLIPAVLFILIGITFVLCMIAFIGLGVAEALALA
ncbi:MAG: YIP1 family protein [Methanomicrobiales archaeon]|jgi:hypothetical protein|nr:YIP1 family protein [Methanomicrobiales archaeon]